MNIFFILLLVAMLAVLGVLVAGLFAMARGGEFNARYGQKLMRARVILQGVALVLFVLVLLTSRHG
jgi:hypothetical protein